MNNQLQKAIRIIKKTGDRLIVINENNNDSYVIMNLDEYEGIVRALPESRRGGDVIKKDENISVLTEEKLVDKINRDIALWKSQQNIENRIDDRDLDNFSDNKQFYSSFNDRENNFYDQDFNKIITKKKKKWRIPKSIKKEAEETIDEDTQYLEGIPF